MEASVGQDLIQHWTGPVFLHDSWRHHLGRPPLPTGGGPRLTPDALGESEWSPRFERAMRDRLIMGALRYGLLNSPGKPRYDRLARIAKDLDRYRETGNDEILVDIANHALLEFEEGIHPRKHWNPSDDGHHHTREKK
jgi:hypothetical protein